MELKGALLGQYNKLQWAREINVWEIIEFIHSNDLCGDAMMTNDKILKIKRI